MFFYWIILFGLLFQHATCQWPGPQKTTKDQNGNEVWVAQGLKNGPAFTYTVQDLGKARPTLVYNCAQAPAICQTVKKYWDNGQTEGQFHYDKDYRLGGKRNHKGVRKSRRRDTNCPHTWKNRHTCPEQNQPKFQAEGMGWTDAVLWKGVWGDQNPEDNRLAQKKGNLKRKSDGTGKQQWEKIGIILTCDEWPAASWIEGGDGGATYCAPQGFKCEGSKNGGTKIDSLQSEQDWQGESHNALGTYFTRYTPHTAKKGHHEDWTIFKFNFKYVDDPKIDHATWVEAEGRKRYCYGPKSKNTADCKPK